MKNTKRNLLGLPQWPVLSCSLLLGLWLGLLLASWAIAAASFRTVDRVPGPALRPELDQRPAPVPAALVAAAARVLARRGI